MEWRSQVEKSQWTEVLQIIGSSWLPEQVAEEIIKVDRRSGGAIIAAAPDENKQQRRRSNCGLGSDAFSAVRLRL